jgi:hypothetical protein
LRQLEERPHRNLKNGRNRAQLRNQAANRRHASSRIRVRALRAEPAPGLLCTEPMCFHLQLLCTLLLITLLLIWLVTAMGAPREPPTGFAFVTA